MMESNSMLCVFLSCLAVLYVACGWLLLRPQVKAIPASDAEDQAMGLYCEPETLWNIDAEIDHSCVLGRISHRQLDAVIKALHKGGYVIMGPSREEITQSAAMYQERMVS